MEERARREVLGRGETPRRCRMTHAPESYMLHQGHTFVDRLDASTCLRIMEVWHRFDLARDKDAADP